MTGVQTCALPIYVLAVGGSWLARRELIEAGAWDQITALAAAASGIARKVRSAETG